MRFEEETRRANRRTIMRLPLRISLAIIVVCLAAGRGTFAQPPAAAHGALPTPGHVVIVIEENKAYGDIIGSADAPYINALAGRGALLTSFYASHHPSQPNY